MTDRSEQLDAAIAKYLQLVESGDAFDVEAFLSRHADMETELRSFIGDYVNMQSLAGRVPMTSPASDQEVTVAEDLSGVRDTDPHLTETFISGSGNAFARAGSGDVLPRVFGDYELTEMIAHGGMGVVYKAKQISLGRTVAVKMILSQQLVGEEHIQRFYREARAAGALDHPGIVPVYEVGAHAGQHFFSMALVDGGSLRNEITDGPLEERVAARHAQDVAEAVAYAHARGVIHRDLKPGNVLIGSDGKLRLTDFGLATISDGKDGVTATGQILGTPSYMPPEQAKGEPENVGPLTDVYSIGAVLYCLLTGRPPFQSANPLETLRRVIETEPVPPRQLNPAVSADLETICLKCLEKERSRRYESATALANDLRRFLEDRPIEARPAGSLVRTSRWIRRNNVASTSAAAASVLILGLALGWWSQQPEQPGDTSPQADHAKEQTGLTEKQTKLADEQSDVVNEQAKLERLVAINALEMGGSLTVFVGEEQIDNIEEIAALPDQDFYIDTLNYLDSDVTDAHLARVAGLSQLEGLTARGAGISDRGLSIICDPENECYSSLNYLDVRNSQLTDEMGVRLGRMPRLTMVKLSGTQITTRTLRAFEDHNAHVKKLWIANTSCDAESPLVLSRIRSLEDLDLRCLDITSQGLRKLVELPRLKEISISEDVATRDVLNGFESNRVRVEID